MLLLEGLSLQVLNLFDDDGDQLCDVSMAITAQFIQLNSSTSCNCCRFLGIIITHIKILIHVCFATPRLFV